MKYVIIGAGIAGYSAAKTIRHHNNDAEIILIGKERFIPYKRFLLTDLLCNSIENKDLFITNNKEIEKLNIKLRKSQYVNSINTENKTIKLYHKEIIKYDKLLIATGGIPMEGPVLRPFNKNIQR